MPAAIGDDRGDAVSIEVFDELVVPLLVFHRAVDHLENQAWPTGLPNGDGELQPVLGRKRQFLHVVSVTRYAADDTVFFCADFFARLFLTEDGG